MTSMIKMNKKGGLFKYLFWIGVGIIVGIYLGYLIFNAT